ncbi:MAG TPA: hypothetical protein VMK12_28255 [Anaeromyxobacteraceae bacterium]|nr:hypothetical protein [Anaeromyxobacteraceae bacterium]
MNTRGIRLRVVRLLGWSAWLVLALFIGTAVASELTLESNVLAAAQCRPLSPYPFLHNMFAALLVLVLWCRALIGWRSELLGLALLSAVAFPFCGHGAEARLSFQAHSRYPEEVKQCCEKAAETAKPSRLAFARGCPYASGGSGQTRSEVK